jgi:bifunctional non-homologous end joining protein LigD
MPPLSKKPAFIEPMAAKLVKQLPRGDGWLYELKYDGYRALVLKHGADIEIRSRNNKELTPMYPQVVAAGARLKAKTAVVDGEIVALDAKGRPSFQVLQHRAAHAGHHIVFYAFDLLHLDGLDLTGAPLDARRARLTAVVAQSGLLLSADLPGDPTDIVAAVRAMGLEGVIAKHRDSVYEPGERSGAWQKLKLELQQGFVVGGYRPGNNGMDSLLVGYYSGSRLMFAGKVRAGFVPHVRRQLSAKLRPLHVDQCLFMNLPDSKSSRWGGGVTEDEMHEIQWVKPQLVVQIRFVEWSAEGRLRHATYVGERTGEAARTVTREAPSE